MVVKEVTFLTQLGQKCLRVFDTLQGLLPLL